MSKNKIKCIVMRFMVWNMQWMTRYVGFIARPFIAWYADREVIACGLRSKNGEVCIIYSPTPDRINHSFFKKETNQWLIVDVLQANNFSGNLVRQVVLPNAKIGDIYIVRVRKGNTGSTLCSPKITVKERTQSYPDLIEVTSLSNGKAYISWRNGEQFDPMIYFLTVEDEQGRALSGIYTREFFWEYPCIKKASLSIGGSNPILLQKDKQYTVKLTIVDFDGWVSCIAKKVFTY